MLVGRVLTAIFTVCAISCLASPAYSLDWPRSIAQYKHTRWTVDDGAPAPIYAIAQGKDGFLYIGASDGLFRFDGVRFDAIPSERQQDDRGSIKALLVANDGSIWVGYGAGGVSRYSAGALRDTNLPRPIDVMRLVQTGDGAVWALLGRSDRPLVRFSNGRWVEIGSDWGLPDVYGGDLLVARDGTLWLSTKAAIYFLRKGSRSFKRIAFRPDGLAALAEDRSGKIWATDQSIARAVLGIAAARYPYPVPHGPRSRHALFDRSGALWGNTTVGGIYKVQSPTEGGGRSSKAAAASVDRFGAKDSLTSDQAFSIVEDREGAIWVGGQAGLDMFRPVAVMAEPSLTLVPAWGGVLLGAFDGDVYLGQHDGVYRTRPGGTPKPVLLGAGEAEAMCQGHDGSIWFVMQQRILRFTPRSLNELRKPESRQAVIDCAVDHRGNLYVTAVEGVYVRSNDRWRLLAAERGDLTDGAMPIIVRASGKLLTYVTSESLRLYDLSGFKDIRLRHPGALRNLKTLYERKDSVLMGGAFGLARWRGSVFSFLSRRRVPALRNVLGITSTPDGFTWIMARRDIVRIATADLDRAFDHPTWTPPVRTFDYFDGLPGEGHRDGKRDAVRGGDGRIWFATTAGIVWIDPARLPYNPLPPPVVISALHVDGRTYRDPQQFAVRSGAERIAIDFSALSLGIPQRVKILYRLEGADAAWVESGRYRSAAYSNLRPGHYRFRVIAANEDGVWNRKGALLRLTIRPTFFQSQLFMGLCVAAALLALWLAYSLRARQLTARVRERLEAKLSERERIARELHDTLLQGFQGLVLRFQSVANRMSHDSTLRASIDEALDRAEAVLTEGRDRVSDLRFAENDADLASAIANVVAKLDVDPGLSISVTEEGQVRPLIGLVHEELLRIAEEALRNVLQHSAATKVEVTLLYGREVQLSVRDNGRGLSNEITEARSSPGHFGLVGMRERAERAGGKFTIVSLPGKGTEVHVTVPARLANLIVRGRAQVKS